MRLLLELHIFLWHISADNKLPPHFRDAIEDSANDVGTGVQKARKLIERDKVDALLGDVNSAISHALAQVSSELTADLLKLPVGQRLIAERDRSVPGPLFRLPFQQTGQEGAQENVMFPCAELGGVHSVPRGASDLAMTHDWMTSTQE